MGWGGDPLCPAPKQGLEPTVETTELDEQPQRSAKKAVETLKKQSREGWRGGHGRGARTEARCCRVHPMGPPGPRSQSSLCLTPWPHPKPSCARTKTSGHCGGRSCLLPNPYLGAKGTRAENRGKRQPSPPHRLPAGRLGAVLAPCVFPQLASFLACWLVFCSRFRCQGAVLGWR